MNQREYERLKREIQAEYQKKLEALEMIWQMAQNRNHSTASATTRSTSELARGFLLSAVKNALQHISGDFSQHIVVQKIAELHPNLSPVKRASVSSALKRLAGGKEIELVEAGSGKRPSVYRVLSAPV